MWFLANSPIEIPIIHRLSPRDNCDAIQSPFKIHPQFLAESQFNHRIPSGHSSPTMSNQTYTLEEVAQRNNKGGNDCWLIYKGAVYNVTDYADEHPGGADLVTDWAGMDCTKAFNDAGHSAEALRDLKKYKIGTVAASATGTPDKSNTKAVEAGETQSKGQQKYKKRPCFMFC